MAERHPSLFIGDRELTFFQRVATEVIETVTQQKITYYAIEGNLSNSDDFYGEATDKVFRQPIEIHALVLYNAPDVTHDKFGTETSYSLKVYIQKFRIEQDLKVTPRMGDFLEFGEKFFEIAKVYEPQLIAGLPLPGFRMGIYLDAHSTRSDVFNPKRQTPNDPRIASDVIR